MAALRKAPAAAEVLRQVRLKMPFRARAALALRRHWPSVVGLLVAFALAVAASCKEWAR